MLMIEILHHLMYTYIRIPLCFGISSPYVDISEFLCVLVYEVYVRSCRISTINSTSEGMYIGAWKAAAPSKELEHGCR